ncbi:MAG: sulfite exporter TauE/SafE family protein [Spirochaetaceae bacterium]|nr:MAG: sulfite exporter TauE/SafE family protein [Spirochaetaceae bacterium]
MRGRSTVHFSAFQLSYLWLPFFGLIVGLLASVIGSGGGLVLPLILILVFGAAAPTAVGTSLAAILPLCAVALLGHHRSGNIDTRLGALFGITGVTGALVGVGLTRIMGAELLRAAFGVYTLLLGVVMVPRKSRPLPSVGPIDSDMSHASEGGSPGAAVCRRRTFVLGSLYGFAGGLISGSFGTSGSAPVLAGLFALRMPLKLVIGTSLMVVLIKTAAALAGHVVFGVIDLTLVLLLTPGTVLGAVAGPRLLARAAVESRENQIRRVLAVAVMLAGVLMLVR